MVPIEVLLLRSLAGCNVGHPDADALGLERDPPAHALARRRRNVSPPRASE